MKFQFTHAIWLLCLPPALAWVIWLAARSEVQVSRWRKAVSLLVRLIVLIALILAIAGLQWLRPLEGVNVFFALDRSDSVPPGQQEFARTWVNQTAASKKAPDRGGIIVFGSEASIESSPNPVVDLQKIQAVVGTERTDVGAAIRLATAAFPETGQKRLVLVSDGNENLGDASSAMSAARALGVTIDVVALGASRQNDVSIQRMSLPANLKKGQTFEAKVFVNSDVAQRGLLRLFRNEKPLGEQTVELEPGKNLFTFPQTLEEEGFYTYTARLEVAGDPIPQNNRATGFTSVRGDPRVLLASADPGEDGPLIQALRNSRLQVQAVGTKALPGTLAELQSYDTIFISNIPAGDLGEAQQKLLESAVRDFGIGLVFVGGDQSYAAGGYRNTPMEATLPVDMELSSKKVLPKGALVLVIHATEFPNGNQWARDIAIAALDALGPQDEMGIVLWDGRDRWLFPLTPVGNKKELGRQIAGMNPGDMPSFQNVMDMAHAGLKTSNANLKHMVVFSDGDPAAPSDATVRAIVQDRITISSVMIGGHVAPQTMIWLAEAGRGRFYDVNSPGQLPQIFIKEAAVILKSAIFEEPFRPQLASVTEMARGIAGADYPQLLGYVSTTAKPRAEVPLLTDKGDPLLAHWQYGLGRAVAFTSDAKGKWARNWLGWEKYRQFWGQVAQWSLRRVDNADFTTDVSVDKGEGQVNVEAVDAHGDYLNFLNLQAAVVGPSGKREMVQLEQTGPGHYEARFATREIGAYLLNVMEMKEGKVRGSQVLGASVNYSPEFLSPGPNVPLLRQLADSTGGKVIADDNPANNPFLHDRQKTYQPRNLWEALLKFAIVLFPIDVGIRRVQLDRAEWNRATTTLRRWLLFWRKGARPAEADESLGALLARRNEVRSAQTRAVPEASPELFQPRMPAPAAVLAGEVERQPPAAPPPEIAPGAPVSKPPGGVTDRLLEAKRKAQRRRPP